VQNEPNFLGRPGPQRRKYVKRSQFPATRAARTGAIVQNEPNLPGGAGRDGAAGVQDAGQMCKTNPIHTRALSLTNTGALTTIPVFLGLGVQESALRFMGVTMAHGRRRL